MTKKVRAYSSFLDQWEDEFNEGLFNFVWNNGCRCLAGFILVSSPVFLIGAATAPTGTNRVDYAVQQVGIQHAFLWGYAGGGVKNVTNAIGSVVGPIIDNGSSDNN